MKATYFLVFIVVIVTFHIAESGVYSHGSRHDYQSGYDSSAKYYKINQKSTREAASRNASVSSSAHKRNISAWGIIAIILGVIIFSTITYYVFILYPYICNRDQTYDSIELTEVNSVCTVSDNVNNMPLYHSSNDVSNSNDISLNR